MTTWPRSLPDRSEIPVTLTQEQWYDHIVTRHAYLEDYRHLVEATITSPELVTQDRRFESRRCFYRTVFISEIGYGIYLKVVVQYTENAVQDLEGEVITAYPVKVVHKGERLLWRAEATT